jgi:hypothetical protein
VNISADSFTCIAEGVFSVEVMKGVISSLCVAAVVLYVVGCVLWFRRHGREIRANAVEWRSRPGMDDEDFLKACLVREGPVQAQAALAARRAIAELAGVPANTILPDDSFGRDLIQLPFWDSLDWVEFTIETERQSDWRIHMGSRVIDEAHKEAGGWHALRVRHVVRAVAASSAPAGNPRRKLRR